MWYVVSMKNHTTLPLFIVLALIAGCGSEPAQHGTTEKAYQPERTMTAEKASLPKLLEAVGTVQAKTGTRVEAQVTGRVLQVLVRPGDKIKAGDELVVLDGRASESRLDQAKQAKTSASSAVAQARSGLAAAQAAFNKTESTYQRMKQLRAKEVVTAEEVEQAESAYLQAKARLGQAEQAVASSQAQARASDQVVQEAQIGLGYTTIKAQTDGEVAKRLVEPGDLAFPGKELLSLQTGGSLQLEAMVRESSIGRVRVGETVQVIISALGAEPMSAVVDEIEPLADPVTRSFLVKARLPEAPGLYPGMFGRLMVPLGQEDAVLAPEAAVTRVGQLETVMVQSNDTWQQVYVRTGKRHGDRVEILSGLSGGETLGIGHATVTPQADGSQ